MLGLSELQDILKGHDIVFASIVGSHVYGCARPDSDTDFLAVVNTPYKNRLLFGHDYNVTLYSPEEYQCALDNQVLYAIEALHAPEGYGLVDTHTWRLSINKGQLKARVVATSQSDYDKAMRLMGYDTPKSRKKLFHSIRVLRFARDLITRDSDDSRLHDFECAAEDYLEIMTDPSEDPEHYQQKWGPIRKELLSFN